MKLSLVVAILAIVLRGQRGRKAGGNDDTTRHSSGRSVRVLACGLAFLFCSKPSWRRGQTVHLILLKNPLFLEMYEKTSNTVK